MSFIAKGHLCAWFLSLILQIIFDIVQANHLFYCPVFCICFCNTCMIFLIRCSKLPDSLSAFENNINWLHLSHIRECIVFCRSRPITVLILCLIILQYLQGTSVEDQSFLPATCCKSLAKTNVFVFLKSQTVFRSCVLVGTLSLKLQRNPFSSILMLFYDLLFLYLCL